MNEPRPVRETEITGNIDLQLRIATAEAKACDVIRGLVQAEDYAYVGVASTVTAVFWEAMVLQKKDGVENADLDQDDLEFLYAQLDEVFDLFSVPSADLNPDDEWVLHRELVDKVWPIVWGE